jgi:hypothetical protein
MGEAQPQRIEMYVTQDDRVPFEEWLLALRDARARARIRVRIDRLSLGNPGDAHPVGAGVSELRSIMGLATVSILRRAVPPPSYSYGVAIKAPKPPISGKPKITG